MSTAANIESYLASLPEPKQSQMRTLHQALITLLPQGPLRFLDGKDETGKVITNPNIGYGSQTIPYANGKTKEFYQAGISANTKGISVYIMGLQDKHYLPHTYRTTIGKATITGYCIQFKKLEDIHLDVLLTAIKDGIRQTST